MTLCSAVGDLQAAFDWHQFRYSTSDDLRLEPRHSNYFNLYASYYGRARVRPVIPFPDAMAIHHDDPVGGIDVYPPIKYTAVNQKDYEYLLIQFIKTMRELWPGPPELVKLNTASSDKFFEILLDDHPCLPRRCDRFLRCSTRSAAPEQGDLMAEPSVWACLELLCAFFNGQPRNPDLRRLVLWKKNMHTEQLFSIHGVYFEKELEYLHQRWAENNAPKGPRDNADGPTKHCKKALGATPYDISPIPGKGLGIVAARLIHKGECIMTEKPTLTLTFDEVGSPEDLKVLDTRIAGLVEMLLVNEKKAFYALANGFKDTDMGLAGIWMTNAFPVPASEAVSQDDASFVTYRTDAIFFILSRLNHSCQPSAHLSWDEENKSMAVYALRNVEANEEITFSYFGKCLAGFTARQAWLGQHFNFTCGCSLCAACVESARRITSDRRRKCVRNLVGVPDSVSESIERSKSVGLQTPGLSHLASVRLALRQLTLERLYDDNVVTLWLQAAKLAASAGDKIRGHAFLRRAWEAQATMSGREHHKTKAIGNFLEKPAELTEWLVRMVREPITFEEPKGLAEVEYEEWLWDGEEEWGWIEETSQEEAEA